MLFLRYDIEYFLLIILQHDDGSNIFPYIN